MIRLSVTDPTTNSGTRPSRWEAQGDAVHSLFQAKTNANPESSVGLMSMGGKGPEVLVTLTTNYGQILAGMHRTKIGGHAHLATGIQIAGLALKHRQNKMQRQRIIVFSCSKIYEEEKELVKLAKKMKKNGVNVDFIAFGDLDQSDTKKLEAFNENVKGGDGSHCAIIPPGPNLLSDQVMSTPIFGGGAEAESGGDASGTGGAGGNTDSFEFGVDPSADPELALALRMSMEEEKARQERENKTKDADKMEGIPEEGGESQPLLDKEGGPSGDKKDKDDDKMDTA